MTGLTYLDFIFVWSTNTTPLYPSVSTVLKFRLYCIFSGLSKIILTAVSLLPFLVASFPLLLLFTSFGACVYVHTCKWENEWTWLWLQGGGLFVHLCASVPLYVRQHTLAASLCCISGVCLPGGTCWLLSGRDRCSDRSNTGWSHFMVLARNTFHIWHRIKRLHPC